MNFGKMIKVALVGASLLGLAGAASADTYDINIYGASAQYTFWNALAPGFIQAQSGCSGVTPATATNGTTNKITYADCGGNTYNIRVSSKASFDGILSLKGDDSYAAAGAAAEKCSAGDPGDPGITRPYYRKMAERDGTLKCEKITLGASDVAGESFTQYSYGSLKGPAEAGDSDVVERSFNGISTGTLAHANPFVVPFGFFVNNNVVKNGTTTIDNLSRMQAVLLFSGQIMNWKTFGAGYPDLPTAICLRHSGSGTHATLDYAVVKGNGWGSSLVQYENRPDSQYYDNTIPFIYFNDGTPDMLNCLNYTSFNGTTAGAVGYADADKANATSHLVSGMNITSIKYQGEYPTADSIMNGRYDFWTNEWAYKSKDLTGNALTLVNNMLTFAADQSKIPSAETNFWVVQSAMHFEKATDQAYPSK